MIKRIAFVSLAVAGLTGPVQATESSSTGDTTSTGTGSETGAQPARKKIGGRVAARPAGVIPPERPGAEAAADTVAASALSATDNGAIVRAEEVRPVADAASGLSGVAEPRIQVAAAASSPTVAASTRMLAVAVLPPLRPSLVGEARQASDAVATEAAVSDEDAAESPKGARVAVLPPSRPALPDPAETASLPDAVAPVAAAAPAQPSSLFGSLFAPFPEPAKPTAPETIATGRPALDAMIARHASLNGVPAALVHRVVVRESKYNPRAVGRGGAMGLMQIKTGTARGLGYEGGPTGLLDAETNLTYAVKYLAGAYRTAAGNFDRAVSYYARGYYYAAKRLATGERDPDVARPGRRLRQEADATPPGVTWNTAAAAGGGAVAQQ